MDDWLGHRDLCSSQWEPVCDCDPQNPVDLSHLERTLGSNRDN